MHTTGFRELDKAVRYLDDRGFKSVQRSAVNAGLRVLANAMRGNSPIGKTGALKRSIGSRFKRYGPKGDKVLAGKVGLNVQTGKAQKKGKFAPHAHLIALGTKDRYAPVGKVKAFPSAAGKGRAKPAGKALAFRGRVSPNDWIVQSTRAASGRALQAAEAAAAKALPKAIAEAQARSK